MAKACALLSAILGCKPIDFILRFSLTALKVTKHEITEAPVLVQQFEQKKKTILRIKESDRRRKKRLKAEPGL